MSVNKQVLNNFAILVLKNDNHERISTSLGLRFCSIAAHLKIFTPLSLYMFIHRAHTIVPIVLVLLFGLYVCTVGCDPVRHIRKVNQDDYLE